MTYSTWPLGKLPKEIQRNEPYIIKDMGYVWDDPRDIIDIFENKVAKFCGSKYAVAVDCCSHGIFLCIKRHIKYRLGYEDFENIYTIPSKTYISVPQQIIYAGGFVEFEDISWSGIYQIKPTNIYDAAVRWIRNMYIPKSLMVLSFQIKKTIPIGRGGIILTDDKNAYNELKLMSYDGRDLNIHYDEPNHIQCMGYHTYMTPEDASRGIILMDTITTEGDSGDSTKYTDVSKIIPSL